ncbi:alpha/beta fold hydrolase [Planctomicrobium sp. SH664]|uniref:alpha/beta fold hydrolase n=1 Tax=Planctomicrobium sp. SH664 TaxID=3448125 RepID=UPI003F5B05A1
MQKRVDLGTQQLNVFDAGSGDPLLFVHGFPLNHRMWQAQLNEFSATHRVLAPDLRGLGKSSGSTGITTMEQFADDLALLLDALEVRKPVTLCGLSMGGYIAWQFWRRHAERLERLIQCNTRAAADSEAARTGRRETAARVLAEGARVVADSMPAKLFSKTFQQQYPEQVEETRQIMLSNPPQGIAAALHGMAVREDLTSRLPTIDIPTLVIAGAEDEIIPAREMQTMAAAMPNARYLEVPSAGHMTPLEAPALVNDAIRDFLDS